MRISGPASSGFRPSLPAVLLLGLLATLWIAGGASQADALGQAVVRCAAALALVVVLLLGPRPQIAARPVAYLLGGAILLVLIQLIPLPPAVWQVLPGREIIRQGIGVATDMCWRPLALVPGSTFNALASLIVPLSVLSLLVRMSDGERRFLTIVLLGMVVFSTLYALFQFAGIGFDNPFMNETPGQMSGNFANRNHFALFLALGCLLALGWAFDETTLWRAGIALGLVILFTLTALASGSRAGLGLVLVAAISGLFLARGGLKRLAKRLPRWVMPVALLAFVILMGAALAISVTTGRAVAIDRLFTDDVGQDMRSRGLPVVIAMIREYFPVGAGLGGFDPLFRMHEPFSLLKPTYFNHAHNDFLEVVLGAGLAGALLLVAGLSWWAWASVAAWRSGGAAVLPRLGSAILLLIILASGFDYPARTPIIMAMIVIAAVWLGDRRAVGASALPHSVQHL